MEHAKILLQTKNREAGTSLHSLLREAGFTVLSIRNRRGLINLATKFKPELLIIEDDAENDTFEAVDSLKNSLHVKILATSCDDNRILLLDKGYDDCLSLPYNANDIKKIIHQIFAA